MAYGIGSVSLKSDGFAIALLCALYLGAASASIALVCSLLQLLSPGFYESIEVLAGINDLIGLTLSIISIILFLVWMYRLHADLRSLFKRYPISSGQALAQLVIPIYNIWGIWNVFATLSARLRAQGNQLADAGSTLRFWLPVLYVALFGVRFLDRLIVLQERHSEGGISPTLPLVHLALSVFLWFIWVEMTKVIRTAISEASRMNLQNIVEVAP
jgi:hypothetical protein